MKLLLITPSFYPAFYYGGPIYSTFELAKALKSEGVDIKVVTTNANGKEKLKVTAGIYQKLANDLPVKYYNSLNSKGFSPAMFFNLWKDIKQAEVIYLISIFSPPTPITLFYNLFLRKKIIISPRGQLGKWCLKQGSRFKKLWLEIFIKPFIKKLYWHLTSEDESRDVKAVYPSAKTFVIPNGIDLHEFDNGAKKKDNLFYKKYSEKVNLNSKIIISLGRIHKKKGFDILIESFNIITKQFSNSFLFIAGEDFGEKSNLLNLIASNQLSDKVFLVEHIEGEEKVNFLKNADVFAMPSHHENFGIVYAEALAAGTPIVASKHTPWQDAEIFNFGKWVENTPEKFAEAIIEILNSNPIQMGVNGRKYIEENFSWRKIGLNFIKQIRKIME